MKICVLLALSPLFHSHYPVNAQEGRSLEQTFLKEAPQKWEEYRRFAERLQGSLSWVGNVIKPASHRVEQQMQLKRNDRCVLIVYERLTKPGETSEVYGLNSNYAFTLAKAKDSNAWVVTDLELEAKHKIRLFGQPLPEIHLSYSMYPFSVHGHLLDALLADPLFKIRRVSSVKRNGEDLVRIDFDFPHNIKEKKAFVPLQGGSFFLDPKRYWCVREDELRMQWANGSPGVVRTVLEVKDVDGLPIIKRASSRQTSDRSEIETTWEFNLHEQTKLPSDEEFTLTAFGLPEPGTKGGKPPLFLSVAIGAVACFVAAAVIWRLRARVKA
jgi:hypothetical protein